MKEALKLFYFQFHTEQHYFLCHDILEEAWKENPHFNKNDAIVSLILFSTGCYHYRRGNLIGAKRSFIKALSVINSVNIKPDLGLDITTYKSLVQNMIDNVGQEQPFAPVHLPLNTAFEQQIIQQFPNYIVTPYVIDDDYIVHHHIKRDRSEVIAARKQALQQRKLHGFN